MPMKLNREQNYLSYQRVISKGYKIIKFKVLHKIQLFLYKKPLLGKT